MGWGQVGIVAGETRANVIPLHTNRGRVAARRRADQRAESARQHPSLLTDPRGRASAEQIAAVVREIDEHRRATGASPGEAPLNELAQRVASVAAFLRQRLTGDYSVDEFGFDPHFNSAIVRPLLRVFFRSWFRVEVSGIENLPADGAALVVANHAGVLPFDGLMLSVAVHDEHPAHRELRLLAADMVFDLPVVGEAARKAGHTMACTTDAHRLLAAGELTAVFPRATRGWGSASRTATGCSGSAAVDSSPPRCGPRRRSSLLDHRFRRDLPDADRRQVAGTAVRAAVLPDHSVVPVGRAHGPGAAAVEMAHRLR